MELLVQTLIGWIDPEHPDQFATIERVLWIAQKRDVVFTIRVDIKKGLPRPRFMRDLQDDLANQRAAVVTTNPFPHLQRDESS